MAAPIIVPITPKDTWVKVSGANGVTSGQIDITKNSPNQYLRTYVDKGATAPVGKTKALQFFEGFEIENATLIDQYVMAVGAVGEVLASL